MIIDIVDKITVINAGKYEAEVMTGANIRMENGLTIPPVKKSKKPSCRVSKSKKENALTLLIDLFFFLHNRDRNLLPLIAKLLIKLQIMEFEF